jgi:2',3'-cyclic-nucleotide 2'-phosphodiesterase/3'-nucleotidase
LKGRYYNFDSAAGIKYTVDVSKPAGERVSIISMKDGIPFDETRDYLVALNSYRGSGGGGHLTTGAGIPVDLLTDRIEYSSTKDLRFHMIEWMLEQKMLAPQKFDNWKVIPENWWKEGMKRDRQLLFPDRE